MASIAVIGTGYVGLVYCAALADLGNDVWGVDINAEKVASLQRGECPIFEPGLPELLQRQLASGRLKFTTDYSVAVPSAEFVFICVDTPSSTLGEADMRAVRSAAAMIGDHLAGHTLIVNKSTMPIGSGDLVNGIIDERIADGATFAVVSNPEFLREGAAVRDVLKPDRVVVGGPDSDAIDRVASLYDVLNCPIVKTDRRTAEMIKYASNSFLATRISFVNEIAQLCDRVGADVTVVARGMGYDPRIGPLFLAAGIGFGGSCFPKDVRALEYMAREADLHPQLLRAVLDINADQRRLFVRKLEQAVGGLHGKRIAVWGLSFKPDTDDMREAPSLDIIRMIEARGAKVHAYDPAAIQVARTMLRDTTFASSAYEAAEQASAVCLLTEWNEFKQIDFRRVADTMETPVMIDGRNLYDPNELRELGFAYVGVGRGTLQREAVHADAAAG